MQKTPDYYSSYGTNELIERIIELEGILDTQMESMADICELLTGLLQRNVLIKISLLISNSLMAILFIRRS